MGCGDQATRLPTRAAASLTPQTMRSDGSDLRYPRATRHDPCGAVQTSRTLHTNCTPSI